MNLHHIHAIILLSFLLIHNCLSSIITKQILLNLADKSPTDPFLKCVQEQHSVAICCWRFPEIEDCPSEDKTEEEEEQEEEEEENDNDKDYEQGKSNEKKDTNLVEELAEKYWLKQYGDEFFS